MTLSLASGCAEISPPGLRARNAVPRGLVVPRKRRDAAQWGRKENREAAGGFGQISALHVSQDESSALPPFASNSNQTGSVSAYPDANDKV